MKLMAVAVLTGLIYSAILAGFTDAPSWAVTMLGLIVVTVKLGPYKEAPDD